MAQARAGKRLDAADAFDTADAIDAAGALAAAETAGTLETAGAFQAGNAPTLPDAREDAACPVVGFAHAAFRFAEEFARRPDGRACWQASDLAGLRARIAEADVLVTARIWDDALLDIAPRLRFIQASSSGTEQFDLARLTARGIRLASAQGVNTHAVAEHALALLLALTRRLHHAARNQSRRAWPPAGGPDTREDELHGKRLLVVGFGAIGRQLAAAAQGLGMAVTGVRRHAGPPEAGAQVIGTDRLDAALPEADAVVLACPLTPQTRGLFDAGRLARMRPGAYLVNVGRGPVVDQAALADALAAGRLAGAGLDCFEAEPLPADSPLWTLDTVVITPHSAGNTRQYERRVIDLLQDNLRRLREGLPLANQVI